MKVTTNQILPCKSAHVVTLSLEEPEGVEPLSLTFPYPVLASQIQSSLNGSNGTISLSLPKALNEPWPCHYSNKSKLKVDQLKEWDSSNIFLYQHLAGMAIVELTRIEAQLGPMPQIAGARVLIGEILKPASKHPESFMVCKDKQPVWRLRAHYPLLRAPDGRPMLLISAYDHDLSKELIDKGHIKKKQMSEDFDRVFNRHKKPANVKCMSFTQEVTDFIGYILRLNSTQLAPSSWQENNLPLGKYSPYLATFFCPLYQEKRDVKTSDCCCDEVPTPYCSVCLKKPEEKLKRCSQCKAVYYCSVGCQKRDWPKHKPACCANTCCRCEKPVKVVKRCSKCDAFNYCSDECLQADWPDHKNYCETILNLDPCRREEVKRMINSRK